MFLEGNFLQKTFANLALIVEKIKNVPIVLGHFLLQRKAGKWTTKMPEPFASNYSKINRLIRRQFY